MRLQGAHQLVLARDRARSPAPDLKPQILITMRLRGAYELALARDRPRSLLPALGLHVGGLAVALAGHADVLAHRHGQCTCAARVHCMLQFHRFKPQQIVLMELENIAQRWQLQ